MEKKSLVKVLTQVLIFGMLIFITKLVGFCRGYGYFSKIIGTAKIRVGNSHFEAKFEKVSSKNIIFDMKR